MRERGDVLDEGHLVETLKLYKRVANAAGFNTSDSRVQAALIGIYGVADCAIPLCRLLERCGDYLRDLRNHAERKW